MKKLKDYPMILRCFELIYADQPYPAEAKVTLLPDAEVEDEERFDCVEKYLEYFKDKTLAGIGVTKADMFRQGYDTGEFNLTESALEHLCEPQNDEAAMLYRKLGFAKDQSAVVDLLLCDFFDGDLREQFQSQPCAEFVEQVYRSEVEPS